MFRAEIKETKKIEKDVKAADHDSVADGKKSDAAVDPKKSSDKPREDEKKTEESVSTALCSRQPQNWSDLFFIIDTLSFNIDMCDLIIFMTKINPVPGLENKKISVDASYLDTSSNTLIVSTTEAGIIENILGRTCQTIEFCLICVLLIETLFYCFKTLS